MNFRQKVAVDYQMQLPRPRVQVMGRNREVHHVYARPFSCRMNPSPWLQKVEAKYAFGQCAKDFYQQVKAKMQSSFGS